MLFAFIEEGVGFNSHVCASDSPPAYSFEDKQGKWVELVESPLPKTGVEEITYVLQDEVLHEIVGAPDIEKVKEQALAKLDAALLREINNALGTPAKSALYAAKYQAALAYLNSETSSVTDCWIAGESEDPKALAKTIVENYEASQVKIATIDNLRITAKKEIRGATTVDEVNQIVTYVLNHI